MRPSKLIHRSATRHRTVRAGWLTASVCTLALAVGACAPQLEGTTPTTARSGGTTPTTAQSGGTTPTTAQSGGTMPAEPGETPTAPGGSTRPPLSRTDLPVSTRPGTPPSTPSDLITGDWLVGTVTTGGTGPCYRLITDDGVEHALYGDAGTPLVRHTRIRAKVEPLDVRISCGPGRSWRLVHAEPLR